MPASNACLRGLPWKGWSPRPRRCTDAWPAEPTQWTLGVPLGATETARVHHAEMTNRKVVADRIGWIEAAQRRGDVLRHAPSRADVAREPKTAPDTDHVRIEWHDQLGRRHAAPHAEIEAVAAHHPSQEQGQ